MVWPPGGPHTSQTLQSPPRPREKPQFTLICGVGYNIRIAVPRFPHEPFSWRLMCFGGCSWGSLLRWYSSIFTSFTSYDNNNNSGNIDVNKMMMMMTEVERVQESLGPVDACLEV